MANSSIPNSILATGRTLTTSSKRSKNSNNKRRVFSPTLGLTNSVEFWVFDLNAQRSTLNAQRSIQRVRNWPLYVERWTFSSCRRVKGAWWPSRSSKPSSPRKWRGRFDSYPLRLFLTIPVAVSLCKTRPSPTGRRLWQAECERR
jgi:hypothetical protein